jgi:hypothetical protein
VPCHSVISLYYGSLGAFEEATAVLREAEQKLRAILVQAAEGGDYDQLQRVAEWAKLLSKAVGGQAVNELSVAPMRNQVVLPGASDNSAHERSVEVRGRPTSPATRSARGGRGRNQRRSKAAKSDYPKFHREGESRVKLGWSKSEGKPYEHRAPRSVLRALVRAFVRAGAGGEHFTMEGLLPLKDQADGTEIPDYQAYLTLAWLRSVGLIMQHGRQGYSLLEGADLERETDRQWNDLKPR